MQIPFLDLKKHHAPLRAEIEAAIGRVIDDNAFSGGSYSAAFEADFATYCGCRHAIGVGSGTDALWLALMALGVGAGDEVITTPNTFIATAEAITYAGATPVFVDIDEATYNLSPALLEAAITPRTRAIVPVHLFGQMADMDPIMDVARRHGVYVVEDAAQAHGAGYRDRRAGSIGDLGCFSFYPGKNLGAFGEAGAVVTNNADWAERVRRFANHGRTDKYLHDLVGWNCRLDGIQGAVLQIKLRHLDQANDRRRAHAGLYDELLSAVPGIITPTAKDYARHVYHLYPIRVRERDGLLSHLAEQGVAAGIHYPVPLHLQEAYRNLGFARGAFPVAEKCCAEFVSLPMFPELTEEQIRHVHEAVRNWRRQTPVAKVSESRSSVR